jgi:hypothetical protein
VEKRGSYLCAVFFLRLDWGLPPARAPYSLRSEKFKLYDFTRAENLINEDGKTLVRIQKENRSDNPKISIK